MKTPKYIILALSILLVGCNNENESYPKVYTFKRENAKKTLPDNWTKCVDIKLETSDSVYVNENHTKTVIADNNIYLYSIISGHPIFHFDISGKYINKFGKKGHAKNEISGSGIQNLWVNTDSKEVEVYTLHKYIKYDYDGNFKLSEKVDMDCVSIFHDKDGYWASTGANTYFSEYELFKTDEHFNIKKKFINRGMQVSCMSPNFWDCPVKVYTFQFSNDIYHIDTAKDTVILAYTFKFPGMEIPEVFQTGNMEEAIKKAENREIPNYTERICYLESEQYIYQLVAEGENNNGIDNAIYTCYHWIIDKKTNKELIIYVGKIDRVLDSYQYSPQFLDDNNILYFLGTDYETYKNDSVHIIGIDLKKLFE